MKWSQDERMDPVSTYQHTSAPDRSDIRCFNIYNSAAFIVVCHTGMPVGLRRCCNRAVEGSSPSGC